MATRIVDDFELVHVQKTQRMFGAVILRRFDNSPHPAFKLSGCKDPSTHHGSPDSAAFPIRVRFGDVPRHAAKAEVGAIRREVGLPLLERISVRPSGRVNVYWKSENGLCDSMSARCASSMLPSSTLSLSISAAVVPMSAVDDSTNAGFAERAVANARLGPGERPPGLEAAILLRGWPGRWAKCETRIPCQATR